MSQQRALTFLDQTGDLSITWDEDTDSKMLGIIEEKMKQGVSFFIIKPTPIVKINRLVKAKNIEEVRQAGKVTIRDEALEKLFLSGAIGTTNAPAESKIEVIKKASNSNEVVENHAVAFRPMRGG